MNNNVLPYSIKIRVKSAEHSAQIQKALFALGYRWQNIDGKRRQYLNLPFLCAHPTSYIKHCNEEDYYNDLDYTEVTLNQLVDSVYIISNTINFDDINVNITNLINLINT
jgi:hypothetical protein